MAIRVSQSSFILILLSLIHKGKTKKSVEINRNKIGKEHSYDIATVEDNSFIEYSGNNLQRGSLVPERIHGMTFKYIFYLKTCARSKLAYNHMNL